MTDAFSDLHLILIFTLMIYTKQKSFDFHVEMEQIYFNANAFNHTDLKMADDSLN